MMKVTISTWEDAQAEIKLKKSVFYRLYLAARPVTRQRRATAKDTSEGARRPKSFDQYVMLVETDVVDGVSGILP